MLLRPPVPLPAPDQCRGAARGGAKIFLIARAVGNLGDPTAGRRRPSPGPAATNHGPRTACPQIERRLPSHDVFPSHDSPDVRALRQVPRDVPHAALAAPLPASLVTLCHG